MIKSLIKGFSKHKKKSALFFSWFFSFFVTRGIIEHTDWIEMSEDYRIPTTLDYHLLGTVLYAHFYFLFDYFKDILMYKEPTLRTFLRVWNPIRISRSIKNDFKWNTWGDLEAKILDLEGDISLLKKSPREKLLISGLYLRKRNADKSISYLEEAIEELSGEDIQESIIRRLSSKPTSPFERVSAEDKIFYYFEQIYHSLKTGDFKTGLDYWKGLIDLDCKERTELNVLFAVFLGLLERYKERFEKKGIIVPDKIKSYQQWKKIVEIILEEKKDGKKFEGIFESREGNEILEYIPSEFLKEVFIFKRSKNRDALKKEYLVNSILWDLGRGVSEEERTKLARPLSFIMERENYSYYISRRRPLKTLEEVFEDASDKEKDRMLIESVKNIRKMHEISYWNLQENSFYVDDGLVSREMELARYNYNENLMRRLIRRLGVNQKGVDLCEAIIKDVYPYSKRFTCVINGDLAISNLLEDGSVIDFEMATIGNPVIDVVTTLEDPKNGKDGKYWIFKHYYLDQEKVEEKGFFLHDSYEPHVAFVSACQTGSKFAQAQNKRKKGKEEENEVKREDYFKKAEKDIERSKGFIRYVIERGSANVKDKFVKYLRSSEMAKELAEVL